MNRGDAYKVVICNHSGTIAIYDKKKNQYFSPLLDGPIEYDIQDKEIINNFFEIFKQKNYCIEYNGHHDAESLLNYGISDKIWSETMPEKNDNFAIFCYPKE